MPVVGRRQREEQTKESARCVASLSTVCRSKTSAGPSVFRNTCYESYHTVCRSKTSAGPSVFRNTCYESYHTVCRSKTSAGLSVFRNTCYESYRLSLKNICWAVCFKKHLL